MQPSDAKRRVLQVLRKEGGAAGMPALKKQVKGRVEEAVRSLAREGKLRTHPDGDIISTKTASRFVVVRGSTGGDESVSTSLAQEYEKQLRDMGHSVDTVDLDSVPYADDWDSKYKNKQKRLMRKADGIVFSSPVYNWGPSARVSAYMQQAIKSGNNPYLPYAVIGAAGSPRAAGSLDAFSQAIAREDKGISIGAPIVGTYDDMLMSGDKVEGIKSESLQQRLRENARIMSAMAQARRDMKKQAAAGTAVKRDPAKWEAAKRQAKAKMGGKHSARAMQLAVQIYKKKGGTYAGKKPSASTNKMRKWTKQEWRTRPGTDPIAEKPSGATSRYLPEKKWQGMSKKEQVKTDAKKLRGEGQYVDNTERAKVKSKHKYY